MNTVDILLGLDNSVLEVNNTKEMEIKRLSKAAGKPFIVKLQGVPAKRFTKIVDGISDKNGIRTDKAYDANVNLITIGMVDPSMKDKALLDKFECSTPGELVEKLFRPSEIGALADAITELSGFGGDNTVAEVKN